MGSHQETHGAHDFEGVSGSRFYYVQDHTPSQRISLGLTNEHIISGAKRKSKAPARLIHGERDIPQRDEWKLRKKPRKSYTTQDEGKKEETIGIIIPPRNLSCDPDDSPLTELEDLPDETSSLASDSSADGAHVASRESPEDPQLHGTDEVGGSQLAPEDGCLRCRGRMINLNHQLQQALLCRSRETVSLQNELEALRRQNDRLRAKLANVTSTNDPTITRFSADRLLDQKDEVDRLRGRLSKALELVEIVRSPPSYDDAFAMSTGFVNKEMDALSNYIFYTADSLRKMRRDYVRDETMSEGLIHLIQQTITSKELLSTEPLSAFRALTFGYIQERIFCGQGIWRDLHFDGLMLRQYQSILEQSVSCEALEKYHRAAVHLALTKNSEFKEAFVTGYAEQIQFEFLNMMAPLLHRVDVDAQFKHRMETLFRHALTLRANCYPHIGTRYQLVQFKPGHVYDPQTMRAEDRLGVIVNVPEDGPQRRIKVCVHGLMKAHSVQENATGLGLIQELSQPFLLGGDRHGHIISDKAVVILES